VTHFCPYCQMIVSEDATTCDYCGADLGQYSEASYEEKLLLALQHPVREHRMIAIQILGQIGTCRAIPEFSKLLDSEDDFYLLREMLHATAKIDCPESVDLLLKAEKHPSKLVRDVARYLGSCRKSA